MQQEVNIDDEVDLKDMFESLANGWKTILFAAFVGAGIGGFAAYGPPDQFVASGFIQNGKIANLNKWSGLQSLEAEPIEVLFQKMKSPTYYDSKTFVACIDDSGTDSLDAFVKSLRLKILGGSSLVSFSYRAESRDKAVRCLEKVLDTVVEQQKDLFEEFLTAAMAKVAHAKKTADVLRKQITALEADKSQESEDKAGFSQATLRAFMYQLKSQELLDVENEIFIIESRLKAPFTQEAKFTTPIFSFEQKKVPSIIVATSAIVGSLFGALIFFLRRGFARVKKG